MTQEQKNRVSYLIEKATKRGLKAEEAAELWNILEEARSKYRNKRL